MLRDIIEVRPLEDCRLRVRFEDGVEGVVNVGELVSFEGVFAAVKEPAYFQQVRVDAELGSVGWPNGADLDPDVLYARITGEPIFGLGAAAVEEPLERV